ncbi:MAG TPA: hypothetical protein VFX24_15420 [Ktedonobacterales bacterium]|jgi:hypothetical protein|nr:hypothetical protein [Ktedonobacterales bacterium]
MERPTYAQLRELLRVIAIGQTQEHKGLRISLLTLDIYDDGCQLKLLLLRDEAVPVSHQQLQHADVNVTDDRGAVYVGAMSVLDGRFGLDFWQYRNTYTFMPTLDPAARELRIEIPAVQTGALGWANAHRDAQSPGETTHGPWSFIVQLPAANT